jgi:hypothetical protein
MLSASTGDKIQFEQLEVVSVPNIERSNPVCGTLGILCGLSRE